MFATANRRRLVADPVERTRVVAAEAPLSLAHRGDLQGLRAVAVLLVALSHAGVTWLAGGFVGVDVFFVLSGFLITGLLLKEAGVAGTVSISEFYKRRVRRILPAAALTLVVTDLAAYQLLNFVRAKQVMWDSVWSTVFVANVHFAQQGTDYFARAQPPSPLQHFWTLSVEEQFYFVWPALLAFVLFGVKAFRRRGRQGISGWGWRRLLAAASLLTLASLAWSIHAHGSSGSYFATPTRAWELGLGAVLAIATGRRSIPVAVRLVAGWAGLAMIATAAVAYSSSTPFPGSAALLPTLGTALVIAAGIGGVTRVGVGRLLALAPLRYVGDRSYTLYLWHWPFLIIALDYEGHQLPVVVNLGLVAAAFVLSIVTFGVYEDPIRRSEWSGEASAFAASVAVTVTIFVAAVGLNRIDANAFARQEAAPFAQPATLDTPLVAPGSDQSFISAARIGTAGVADTLPAVRAAVAAAHEGRPLPSPLSPPVAHLLDSEYSYPAGCAAHDGDTSSAICRLGDTTSGTTIAVIGDSHAQMWMPAILATAVRDHYSVVPIGKSSCGPSQWKNPAAKGDCRGWYFWALGQARKLHPDATVIGGDYFATTGTLQQATVEGVAALAGAMKHSTKHIIVIGDAPGVNQQPVDCLLGRHASMQTCMTTLSADVVANDAATEALLEAIPGVSLLDTRGWLCDGNECPSVVGHTVVYFDTNHLTATYAAELGRDFRAAFTRAEAPPGASRHRSSR